MGVHGGGGCVGRYFCGIEVREGNLRELHAICHLDLKIAKYKKIY